MERKRKAMEENQMLGPKDALRFRREINKEIIALPFSTVIIESTDGSEACKENG